MSLKITLKNDERLIIGGAVVRNGGKGAILYIENIIPILREKDIMGEKDANTPCKRIYFTIQLMYIDEANIPKYRSAYSEMAGEILRAAPSTAVFFEQISECFQVDKYYQALKTARNLIEYETNLLGVCRS